MTLDERIEQLMQPGCDYDPLRPDNLAETLANITVERIACITFALRENRLESVGYIIKNLSDDMWKSLAHTQAIADEEREQDEACQKCGGNEGKGCPECDAKQRRELREGKNEY